MTDDQPLRDKLTSPLLQEPALPDAPSPAQQAASRANGARSRGPATAAGKAAAARNGTRHGLRGGAFALLPGEDAEELDLLRRPSTADWRPRDAYERHWAAELVAAMWRQQRLRRLELAALAAAAGEHPPTEASLKRLLTFARYGARIDKDIAKALRALRVLAQPARRLASPTPHARHVRTRAAVATPAEPLALPAEPAADAGRPHTLVAAHARTRAAGRTGDASRRRAAPAPEPPPAPAPRGPGAAGAALGGVAIRVRYGGGVLRRRPSWRRTYATRVCGYQSSRSTSSSVQGLALRQQPGGLGLVILLQRQDGDAAGGPVEAGQLLRHVAADGGRELVVQDRPGLDDRTLPAATRLGRR